MASNAESQAMFRIILALRGARLINRGSPSCGKMRRAAKLDIRDLESLETRLLPAVIALFDPNLLELQITATGDDTVAIAADALGNVMVNGSTVTASVALAKAADVQRIVVNPIAGLDGPGANLIDLTGVTKAAFSNLTDGNVVLNGGAGADTIFGSQFGDAISGGADE